MNVQVYDIKSREPDDIEDADYWLCLRVHNWDSAQHARVEWEVPVTKGEIEALMDKLPKPIREKVQKLQEVQASEGG